MTPEEIAKLVADAYKKGFRHGLQCFAHWDDGRLYVGTTGTLLNDAINKMETLYTFSMPRY